MKTLSLVLVSFAIFLSGCLDTTEEITVKSDGSGTLTNVTDMSMILSMAKTMGGEEMKGKEERATDTTVSLSKLADSIPSITNEDRAILRQGKLHMVINLKDEKMVTRLEIPFSKLTQIDRIKLLSSKVTQFFIGRSMNDGGEMPPDLGEKLPTTDPISDYFTMTYAPGLIEKKLDTVKYKGVNDSEAMKGVKELSDNGMPLSNTIVLTLPKPAKNVTGKHAKLSEDKKQVTIKSSSEDFFEDASALEFRVEY